MAFHHAVGGSRYRFDDLRSLLAKASPPRSGDVLAGLAAASEEERVAARFALADLPLRHLLAEAGIFHGHFGGGDGELGGTRHTSRLLEVHVIFGLKSLHLTSNAAGEVAGVKLGDGGDA